MQGGAGTQTHASTDDIDNSVMKLLQKRTEDMQQAITTVVCAAIALQCSIHTNK